MNKSDLVDKLRLSTGINKFQAEKVVEIFFQSISDALAEGKRMEIRGFCSFFVKNYPGYVGRNPKTGKKVTVKAKRLPFFKIGKELKKRIMGR